MVSMAKPEAYQQIGVEAEKLRSLADELHSIAAALSVGEASDQASETRNELEAYTLVTSADQVGLINLARIIYRGRRARDEAFSEDALFGEPAWDILLDLYIAEVEGKPLSVTAACIGAAVPTSTALRWLVILEERGLVRRENDTRDARRVFLYLTRNGHSRMTNFLSQLQRDGLTPV